MTQQSPCQCSIPANNHRHPTLLHHVIYIQCTLCTVTSRTPRGTSLMQHVQPPPQAPPPQKVASATATPRRSLRSRSETMWPGGAYPAWQDHDAAELIRRRAARISCEATPAQCADARRGGVVVHHMHASKNPRGVEPTPAACNCVTHVPSTSPLRSLRLRCSV